MIKGKITDENPMPLLRYDIQGHRTAVYHLPVVQA